MGMRIEIVRAGDSADIDPRTLDLAELVADAPVGIVIWSDEFAHDRVIFHEETFRWTPLEEEEVVETLKLEKVVLDGEEWEAGLLFETGGCSQLAKALAQRNHGLGIIALYDAVDEDGEALDAPHLIHAGLAVGDGHVLDANGVSTLDDWRSQWAALGLECSIERYEPGEDPFAYASNQYRLVAQDFALVLSVGCARSIIEHSPAAAPFPR